MDQVAPAGPVYQAGTLSGNPLAVTAGIATLKILQRPGTYQGLEQRSQDLAGGMVEAANQAGVPVWANRVGSMFTTFFTPNNEGPSLPAPGQGTGRPVVDWQTAKSADTGRFAVFFREMLARGVYLAPSQFEAGFVSTAHSAADIEQTLGAAREALAVVARILK